MSELSDFIETLLSDENKGVANYEEFLQMFKQEYKGKNKEYLQAKIIHIIVDEYLHAEILEEIMRELEDL